MTFFELFLIGIGLSMDAFAVSICKGLSMQKIDKKYTLCIGLFFGGFQALMPLTGYLLGSQFSGYIERFDHWIAFVLLALIGFNMIKESREEEEEEDPFDFPVDYTLWAVIGADSATRTYDSVAAAFVG